MGASAPGAQAFVLAGGSVTPHLPGLAPPGEQPREKGGARWTPDEEHELKRLIEEVGAKLSLAFLNLSEVIIFAGVAASTVTLTEVCG